MIECRTELTQNTIKALTKYHINKQGVSKKKKTFTVVIGIFLLILSIINTYGYWMKYYGTESIFMILLRSSVLILLSTTILYTSIKGTERKLYRELKEYFSETKTKYIDYIISENGIQLKINNNATLHNWDAIEHIEADDKFYYFTSNGKHSIIAKESMSAEDKTILENSIINKLHNK